MTTPLEKIRVRLAAEAYSPLPGENRTNSAPAVSESDDDDGRKKKKCGKLEKELGVLLGVCLIIILSMSAVIVIQALNNRKTNIDPACRSPECVKVAGRMIKIMNLTADPCTDFYNYACGNWINYHIPPPNRPKYDVFSVIDAKNTAEIQKLLQNPKPNYYGVNSSAIYKAHLYYNSCIDEETTAERGAKPLLQLIKSLGSWPVTNDAISGTWNEASWDFTQTLIDVNKLGKSPFFGIGVSVNDYNSTQNIIVFEQSGISLSDRSQYIGNHSEKYHQAFLKYFTRIAELLGVSDLKSANESAEEIWQFEKNMSQHFLPRSKLWNTRELYHNMTLEQVQQIFGGETSLVQLKPFMEGLFPDPVSMEEIVVVYMPKYLKEVGKLIQKTPKRVLANYLVWKAVQTMVPYLNTEFKEAILILKSVTKGVKTLSPPWERCVARTSSWLAFAVGGLFVQDHFGKDQKSQVKDILNQLKTSLIDHFPEVEWMDKPTKERAIIKAKGISDMIGYPEWIQDPKKLDEYYSKFELTGDNEFQNALNGLHFFVNKTLAKHGKPVNKTEWHMGPSEVNAYYSHAYNSIVFPAGVLQWPIYDKEAPMSVKFGALGMVMGHEMTHGFDNSGRMYDKDGNMVNWWGNSSTEQFQERVKCMVDQYSKYKVGNGQLNGALTKAENIADNGGLKLGLKAYQTWQSNMKMKDIQLPGLGLSDTQQFFLGFSQVWCSFYTPEYAAQSLTTDVHSYAPHRVLGTLSNMKSFSEAFKCKKGARMNPDNKCVVW